jgi:glutamate dehydrogenase (NAD(P)+)
MAARLMTKTGFKIVCIVEWDGAVYNPHGLDIEKLMDHRRDTGSIRGFPGAEDVDKNEALLMNCEVLIPAARENVITSSNADRIKAKVLCEGANGPTTFVADSILAEKKVFVITDILANAGGVTVSYFEWVQDRQGYFWSERRVNEQLEEIMVASFNDVTHYANQHGVNNRTAAYMLALDRVANAIRKRGLYA